MNAHQKPIPLKNTVPNKVPMNAQFIYVLGDIDGATIKVGIAKDKKNLLQRKKSHQKRGPDQIDMVILAVVRGFLSDEKAVKDYFKTVVVGGEEWLNPSSSELRSWIRFLKDQPYVAESLDEVDIIPLVDSSAWLPGGTNFKPPPYQPKLNLLEIRSPWDDLQSHGLTDGDYYTPREMIEAARMAMGSIDLDPSSCKAANMNVVKASRFYGVNEDGLSQPWAGNVWLNPPFGQWDLWTNKTLGELPNVNQICFFITANAATQKCVHPLIRRADASFIPNGRYSCWGPKSSTAREGNFIFYIGNEKRRFAEAFSRYGATFYSASCFNEAAE